MSVNFKVFIVFAHLCALCLGLDPGYTFYPTLRGSLKLHTTPDTWFAARNTCHNENALLACPWSPDFVPVFKEILSNASIKDILTGTRVTYLTFKELNINHTIDEVSNFNVENCGVFFENGTKDDADCWLILPYLCFKVANEETAPASTDKSSTTEATFFVGTCEGIGYEFSNKTGRCYKFHSERKSWFDSMEVCKNENSTLAIINSYVEAGVLVSLFEKHPSKKDDSIVDKIRDSYARVGFYNTAKGWMTVEGQTIEQAGYVNWREHNSVIGLSESHPYGSMNRQGSLFPGKNSPFMFICEKGPY